MEASVRGKSHPFYGLDVPDLLMKEKDFMGHGKKSMEWDLNDWKWDGNLFIASPLNSVPSDCRSKQIFPVRSAIPASGGSSNSSSFCSDDIDVEGGKGKGELEKRRRVIMVEDDELNDEAEAGSLTLNLGGHVFPILDTEAANLEGRKRKSNHLQGPNSGRTVCQVEGCWADLSTARDYHRRHKVCEMHSKATKAVVGNVVQRFCQQCSRFHVLEEFDEGKRSCRRRLAGHNRRRRKNHPDAVVGGSSLNDDRASSYLLITLLRILSNLHSNTSDQAKDQDLLSHLLRNLASLAGTSDGRTLSGILQASQDLQKNGTSIASSSEVVPSFPPNGHSSKCLISNGTQDSSIQAHFGRAINESQSITLAAVGQPQQGSPVCNLLDRTAGSIPPTQPRNKSLMKDDLSLKAEVSCSLQCMLPPDSNVERAKLNNIDLNNIYIDSEDHTDSPEKGNGSVDYPSWAVQDSQQSSPPHTSGNSDSPSDASPSSSNGDAQSRTGRIVFKLFGKDPSDFPCVVRAQILDWLSQSPTDIESYIRPGCIILTIYLRLTESIWDELCCELSSSLCRLLDASSDPFWRTGWIYARVQHQMAFIYNGQVVLDTSLPFQGHNYSRIASITPIAVCVSGRATFTIKGFNLSRSGTRFLCAFEGMYLAQEASDSIEDGDTWKESGEIQCYSYSCILPNVTGRGFIEVEDCGLSSSFFPFIVAEQDLCSEICTLESAFDVNEFDVPSHESTVGMKARNQALDFLHEMGWLLRRSHLNLASDHAHSGSFPLERLKWLMEFSMDRDWCVVVKKLLDFLFSGAVDAAGHSSIELALPEMGLLHKAVRRNCRPMVELLLRYVPEKSQHGGGAGNGSSVRFLFRPDMLGPAGVTPLHIAASRDDTEDVLDALTNDPGQVGIEAWKSARDSSGFAPEDYACLRGYYSYIRLVRKKINKKLHVILDIPSSTQKQMSSPDFTKLAGFQIYKQESGPIRQSCRICERRLRYGSVNRALSHRPLILSLMAIAAVCICVGLFFHGPPEVLHVSPFRWELVKFGSI